VAAWIAETEAEKASYALAASKPEPRRRLTEQEIKAIVRKFADIARVLIDADPDDKAEIFRKLGLKLACHPARYLVKAQVEAAPHRSLWRRVARALGKVLACLAHRHGARLAAARI
jgi:ketopantoate reductase